MYDERIILYPFIVLRPQPNVPSLITKISYLRLYL